MKRQAAIISYVTIAVNLIYGVVLTPFIIRALGQGEYGVYTLSNSIISYLSLFQFGFSDTFIRYYIQYKIKEDDRKVEELSGMFAIIFLIIAAAVLLAGIVLLHNIERVFGGNLTAGEYHIAQQLLKLVIANCCITVCGVPFQALITANEKFVFQKLVVLLELVVRIAAIVLILFLGYKSVAIVSISTVLAFITFCTNGYYCLAMQKNGFRFSNFVFTLFKEMSGFSFFVFLQSIVDIFNWQIDRILIARYWGAAEVAVYSVGAQFSSVFTSLTTAVTSLFVPRANRMVAEGQGDWALSRLLITVGRPQFMLASFILSAFVFFGKPFLRFYSGAGYDNAYYVAILLIAPLVLPLSMGLWYHIARAKAKHKTSTSIFVAVAFLNLSISIPLCKRFAEIGAAAGTCIGVLIANNLFQMWYIQKVIHLDMKWWLRSMASILPALIPPILLGVVVLLWGNLDTVPAFLGWAVLYGAVSAVSYWKLACNPEEKRWIAQMWERFRR